MHRICQKKRLLKIFAQTGYSRLPVYEGSIDHIMGIIYQKDFHNYVYHTNKNISAIIRPVLFIAKSKNIGELLKELQQNKSHIAVVMDEFGGTVGIVTLEDVLEELVGEIWDEHDKVVEEIEKVSENEYLVLGSANVEKLFEELDREEEFEVLTVSGWVMDELDKVPEEGDEFEYEGLKVKVLQMDGKRVGKVRITIEQKKPSEESDEK